MRPVPVPGNNDAKRESYKETPPLPERGVSVGLSCKNIFS